jgi:hypothetical protein
MRPDSSVTTMHGFSRNCTCFDNVRETAYREVLDAKRAGKSLSDFQLRLEGVAPEINLHFPEALPLSAIRAIAMSNSLPSASMRASRSLAKSDRNAGLGTYRLKTPSHGRRKAFPAARGIAVSAASLRIGSPLGCPVPPLHIRLRTQMGCYQHNAL